MSESSLIYPSQVYSEFDATDEDAILFEDDIQCGHVFFNESSRVLKFYCIYCREVCEDINYFCEHLSVHINDVDAEETQEEELDDSTTELNNSSGETAHSETYMMPTATTTSLLPADLAGFDESKMVVEELDEAEEIAAEVEEELRQELESEQRLYKEENSCSSDFCGYDESHEMAAQTHNDGFDASYEHVDGLKQELQDNVLLPKVHTDFEHLIDNAVVQPSSNNQTGSIRPHVKKKKKKITTVKVIAFKNRVAELYERIKSEEEKRSKGNDEQKITDENVSPLSNTNAPLTEDNNNEEADSEATPRQPVLRQVIGETVITLIPPSQTQQQLAKFPTNPIATLPPSGLVQKRDYYGDKTTCPACGKKFRSAFSLNIHKRTHYLESNSNIKLAHKCSDCDQLFNKISDLKDHIQEVHYPEGFICKICNKKLTSLTLLEMHMLKVHLARPFNCQVCRKNFDTRDRFEEHVTAHFSGQHYKCHICGRKYSTECILKQHMRRHKERIPQCCVVCGKMTLRITQHMKIHAPRPKRILSCRVCGKVFNFSSGLSHHFKVMHKLPRPPPKLKKERANITPIGRNKNVNTDAEEEMPQPILLRSENAEQLPKSFEEIHEKEEEAKRVIVELIQNATYTSFLPENFCSTLETGPPIAREETISAVNSIVNDDG